MFITVSVEVPDHEASAFDNEATNFIEIAEDVARKVNNQISSRSAVLRFVSVSERSYRPGRK